MADAKKFAERGLLWSTALVALVLAAAALLLGQVLPTENNATPNASCPPAVIEGISAYELWLTLGNTGSEQDFLDSLVGQSGTDGFVGPAGDPGKSAYKFWLEAGNTGTEQEFLDSLAGASGRAGFGAYELWLSLGNDGSEQEFLNSLIGDSGHVGISGSTGSAGPSGGSGPTGATGPSGPAGPSGSPGVCYIGDTGPTGQPGPTGATGQSAYDIWLANLASPAPTATAVSDFLFSLKGDKGDKGDPGTNSAMAFGSFWDDQSQGFGAEVSSESNTAHPMYFGLSDSANSGITVDSGDGDAVNHASHITFENAGIYNISFSAQISNQVGSSSTVSIWLRRNGSDVSDSNTDITIGNNNSKAVAAWNFFVPVECETVDGETTCDNYQLMWSHSNGQVLLLYQGPQSMPDRPAIPSIILTVNQIN